MGVSSWDQLNTLLTSLTSKVCDSVSEPCGSCCGTCLCSQCMFPKICADDDNYCTVGISVGKCCSNVTRECTPTNNCFSAICDPQSNSGIGACISQQRTDAAACPPESDCYYYTCNAENGNCESVFKGYVNPNKCFSSFCDNGVLVNNTEKICTPPNACYSASCNSNSGQCTFQQNSTNCLDLTDKCLVPLACDNTTFVCPVAAKKLR